MDYFQALKKQGLSHLIPAHKQRRSYPYSLPTRSYASIPASHLIRQKQQEYGVWSEFRGMSAQDGIPSFSLAEHKQHVAYANRVFDRAVAQLGEYHRRY